MDIRSVDSELRHMASAGQLPHVELLVPSESHRLDESADALSGFVAAGRSWSRELVRLERRTTVGLWLLTGAGGGVCAAMLGLLRDGLECRGLVCSVATFGGRPTLTLVLAALGTVALLAAAVVTRGLTQVRGRGLWLVVPGAVLTAVSVVGAVVALAVAVLLVIAAAFGFFLMLAVVARRS